jgi:hypothetical protein
MGTISHFADLRMCTTSIQGCVLFDPIHIQLIILILKYSDR